MITPSGIGPHTRPVPVDGTATVTIGGETVIVDGWRRADVVSETGAIIWHRSDGTATIGEIAAGIAADLDLDAERDRIETDVLDFVHTMAIDGFFTNIDPFGDAPAPDVRLLPVEPVMNAGTVVADLEAVDLDGHPARPPNLDAASCLLVHWSPHCGHCASTTGWAR